MDSQFEPSTDRDVDVQRRDAPEADQVDTSQPGHADTGSAAGVGGVTGAAIGAAAGPIGAAVGAVSGMVIGAATERMMHVDDDRRVEHAQSAADLENTEAANRPGEAIVEPGLRVDRDTVAPPRHDSPLV